jgi:hypothetical protein
MDERFVGRVLDASPRLMKAGFRDRVQFRSRCVAPANLGWATRNVQASPEIALRMARTSFSLHDVRTTHGPGVSLR